MKSFTDSAYFASETHFARNGSSDTRWGVDGVLRQNLNASMGMFESGCVPIFAQSYCASNANKNHNG